MKYLLVPRKGLGVGSLICFCFLFFHTLDVQGSNFRRGDLDGNNVVDITDPLLVIEYSILGSYRLSCLDSGDANDDGRVDISDTVYLLGYIFRGTDAPPAPFNVCGSDETPDGIECLEYNSCPQVSLQVEIEVNVFGVEGAPLPDATVTFLDQTLSTDHKGSVTVSINRDSDEGFLVFHADFEGRSSNQARVVIGEDKNSYQVGITLLPVHLTEEIEDPSEGFSLDVRAPGDLKGEINIPPGAINTTGPVQVEVTLLDPTGKDMAGAPGNTLLAQVDPNEDNGFADEALLESFGMLGVNITDLETGEYIHDLNAPATIEMSLPELYAGKVNEGDQIPLWHFNEELNLWVQEGVGYVAQDESGELVLRGEVHHFSWWNWDQLMSASCFCGEFEVPDTWDDVNYYLGTVGVTYSGNYYGVTHAANADKTILPVLTSNGVTETSRLAINFGGPQHYYLKEVEPGVLEVTSEAIEAVILESPTIPGGNLYGLNAVCVELPDFQIRDTELNYQYTPIIAHLGSQCLDDVFQVDLKASLTSALNTIVDITDEVVEWSSDSGTFSDPNSVNTQFFPAENGSQSITLTMTDSQGDEKQKVYDFYLYVLCPEEGSDRLPPPPPVPSGQNTFLKGDTNFDGQLDVSDTYNIFSVIGVTRINDNGRFPFNVCEGAVIDPDLGYDPPCLGIYDVNSDGFVDCSDAQMLLDFMFVGGPAPTPGEVDCP